MTTTIKIKTKNTTVVRPQISKTSVVKIKDVGPPGPAGGQTSNNETGYLYLWGDSVTNGSIRFHRLDEVAHIEKLVDGVWEHASFMTGSASVWIGEEVAISAVGHHLASEDSHSGFGIMPHSHFDNDTMLTDEDTHVAFSYAADPALVFQGDDSAEWTGKTHSFTMVSPDNILVKSLTYKTGATAATSNIMIRYYEGTDATGPKIFEQEYPAHLFVANSAVTCVYSGILEFDKGSQYYVTYTSTNDFSLKMEPTLTYPWMTGNTGYVRADSLYQTREYVSDYEWTADTDWLIQGRKIYVCNTTGIQTGTFAENVSKWDLLTTVKHVSDIYIPLAQKAAANGVATLDGTSKIPMAQMPVGAMEWKGMWNAATNTPTLTNGNGDITGDVYECNVAGTADFGAGGITFEVGDWVVYNGTIWEKSVNSESYWYIDGTELKPRDISKNVDVAADFYLGGLAHVHTIKHTDFAVKDGTRDRITAGMTDTTLVSPNGNKSISVGNTEISFAADGQSIFGLTKNQSFWWADNSNNYLAIASNLLTWKDGTRTRLTIDSDEVKFFSDDGTKSINLKNTGTVVTGDLTVSADQHFTAASSTIHTGANFAINDGTSDRLKVEVAGTLFYSPDGNSNLSVSDESFGFNDSVRPRLGISPQSTYFNSANGANSLELNDSFNKITGDVHFGANDQKIYSSDAKGYLQFGSSGNVTWYDVDNARTRLNITGLGSFLTSPQGAYSFTIAETGLRLYRTGFDEQLEVSTTASILRSPDESKVITLNNSGTSIAGDLSLSGNATFANNLVVGTAGSYDPQNYNYITLARWAGDYGGTGLICQGGGNGAGGYYEDWMIDNFWGNLRMGSGQAVINIHDNGDYPQIIYGNGTSEFSALFSRGKTSASMSWGAVGDTGKYNFYGTGSMDIQTDLDVGMNLIVGSNATSSPMNPAYLTLSRWAGADHASTALVFQGGHNVGGHWEDFAIDNFYGYLRHWVTATSDRTFMYENNGTGGMQMYFKGNLFVEGNDGFDSAGETAHISLGDDGSYIRNTFGGVLDIMGYGGIHFSINGAASALVIDDDYVAINTSKLVLDNQAGNIPSVTGAGGTIGTMTFDSTHLYIMTGVNQWKRVLLSTW